MGNLKQYRFLNIGDVLQEGDEISSVGRFRSILEHQTGVVIQNPRPNLFRRPIPLSGQTAFLVNYSPTFRVVFDATGMTEEQVKDKMVELAKREFEHGFREYLKEFEENIDWESPDTKLDDECPYDPSTDIHGKKGVDLGSQPVPTKILECIFETDVFKFTKGFQYLASENLDPGGWEVFDDEGHREVFFDITHIFKEVELKYRSFMDGDAVEDGDQ